MDEGRVRTRRKLPIVPAGQVAAGWLAKDAYKENAEGSLRALPRLEAQVLVASVTHWPL